MEGTGIQPVMPMGNSGFGFDNSGIWLFAILALMWGGNGFFGNRGYGYGTEAVQADVNRGFDNQNLQAQTRDILAAVTSGTAQAVATTNQTFHDTVAVLSDKYNEIVRDVAAVQVGQANLLANQNECCCATQRAIDGVKYDNLVNTQKILDALSANKIDDLQAKVADLQAQLYNVGTVKYPLSMSYNAGASPFCSGCGCLG